MAWDQHIVNAGIDAEYIRSLGIPPWEQEDRDRVQLSGYVRGAYNDEGPLTALLWSEIRAAYGRHNIDYEDATMFELSWFGLSLRRMAEKFRVSKSTVGRVVLRVKAVLEADRDMGIATTVYEHEGWEGFAYIMSGLRSRRRRKAPRDPARGAGEATSFGSVATRPRLPEGPC
jgi:hypothetical protein